ncbi:MAG TPA: hypothetical protein EYN66_17430, partial [Myxococcales bacterium]|nr:hypothetical protein [Myxococcales bacterium]
MADIASVNAVAAASIASINGVAKAAIANLDGMVMVAAASGATLWTLVGADGGVGTAPASDLNSWVGYVSGSMGNADYNSIAYGKDGNGDPLWVAVNSNNNNEIRYSSDPSAGIGAWTNATNANDKMLGVAWGNNVWIAVGKLGEVRRSTDGATWSLLNLSGVTGWVNNVNAWDVVSDGAGKWMFCQGMNVFLSTDDGSTWSRVVDLSGGSYISDTGYLGVTMSYTASRWCVVLRKTGQSRAYHAASTATGTWTASTYAGGYPLASQYLVSTSGPVRMAAANGVVIIASANDT